MTTDESNTCSEAIDDVPTHGYEGIDWGLIAFFLLGVTALGMPNISIAFLGVYWAAIVAVGIFAIWFTFMPTRCINGGLICSVVAIAVLVNTIGFVFGAVIRFVASLFG